MSAEGSIARLDRSLARSGDDAILQRIAGAQNQAISQVKVRARVTAYKPAELTDSIIQGDSLAVISPTQIISACWSNGQSTGDTRVPNNGNKLVVQGRQRNIQAATPSYINGELVRIELQLRG